MLARLSGLLAACAVAVTLTLPSPAYAAETVGVKLQDVSGTGADGTAILTATSSGDLIVQITATGLAPNLPHLQHLHGSTRGTGFQCREGMAMYDADIFLSLTTTGDTSWTSGLAVDRMPVADAHGDLVYERTIPAADLPPGTIAHLADLHIVQHGIDANHNGRYDLAGLGESAFARSLGVPNIPAEETQPVTCGVTVQAAAAVVPHGGVATGDGSTAGGHRAAVGYAIGVLLVVAAAVIALRWRRTRSS